MELSKMTHAVIAIVLLTCGGMVAGALRPLPAEECVTGFSVVTSELVVPGKSTAVFLTLNHPAGSDRPSNVTLRLFNRANVKLIEINDVIVGHGVVTFPVPREASGTCALHTLIDCATLPDSGENPTFGEEKCDLKSVAEVRVAGKVREIIVRPAKHLYRPEETVTFWTLAIDHDLRVASGTVGTISVRDPHGTKVAVWDQVTFEGGVASYSLPLSPDALIGRWTIAAEADQSQYVASFDVTPRCDVAASDVSVAEEHYVELKFGSAMRRRYKPGLPFAGKVEAMSTEKSVRVRVKVYDNATSIYSQDIEISKGAGAFLVPAILADSDVIHLQAELVSVENEEIESHYVLAREPIRKWNSTSDCYLLIEGLEHTFQPDELAHVTVMSTCACARDLHYVITTDGRVTDWSKHSYDVAAPSVGLSKSCNVNFTFAVQSIMAPVSQLLVYHVTAQGEPISDVIAFEVRLYDAQVRVTMEPRDWWAPQQPVAVEIAHARPAALVCLLGGRAETAETRRFDPTVSEESIAATNRVDFLEAGVTYFQRACARRGNGARAAILLRQSGGGAGPSGWKRRTPENLVGGAAYDQLWMWRCYDDPTRATSIDAPASPGNWSVWAVTVTGAGLRFSAAVTLTVFRPLTVDFRLPRTLRAGESAEVDVKIGNNVDSCVDVTALLALSAGAKFQSNQLQYVTERLRLGPHGATSLVVKIAATNPGRTNLTVEVNGYASTTCEGVTRAQNASLSGAVLRSAILTVLPEGRSLVATENSYFCANERLVTWTGRYQYEWMAAPKTRQNVVVQVRTSSAPIRIGLSEKNRSKPDKMYSITVGGAGNAATYVTRGKHHFDIRLASIETPDVLSLGTWTTLWVTWSGHVIRVGTGPRPDADALLSCAIEGGLDVAQIGFGADRDASAQFRIWHDDDEAGFSHVMRLRLPSRFVPGTERGQLTVTGGLTLTAVSVVDGGLAGAVAAFFPLSGAAAAGKIQTLLTYKRADGSFGEHPMFGSHKATVVVMALLCRIQAYAAIDPDLIQAVKRWVQLRQEDDGRFVPLQADAVLINASEPVGNATAFENAVEMTAETVIALYKIGVETDTDADTIEKAKIFLENSLPHVELPETIAAVTLALVLVKSATATWAVEKLRNASTCENGEFGWLRTNEARSDETSSAAEFKAALHALAAFCLVGDVATAQSAVKYAVANAQLLDRHYELYYVTFDTFELYNSMETDRRRLVTVSLATSGMELTETVVLNENRQTAVLYPPTVPTKVFVYATGTGCATIQGKTAFSTYAVRPRNELLEITAEILEEISADRNSLEEIEGKLPALKIRTCLRWTGDRPSPVIRVEHELFTGYELAAPAPQVEGRDRTEMQHGNRGNGAWFVLGNVTSSVCVRFHAHTAYVTSALRPAYARAFPAARPDLTVDTWYHVTDRASRLLQSVTDDDLVTWFGKR